MNTIDKSLLFAILSTIIFGLIMVLSASFPEYQFAKFNKQLFFVSAGFIIAIPFVLGMLGLGSEFLKTHPIIVYVLTSLLLLAVFLPIDGNSVNGSTRWINLQVFKLQPSEIAKLIVITSMAIVLVKYKTHDWHGTALTFAVLLPFSGLLLAETDIGATLLIIITAITMVFVAGTQTKYLLFTGVVVALLLVVGVYFFLDNRVDRIMAFLTGEGVMDTQRASAMMGIMRGGWLGVGIGGSLQKLGSLPEAHNDMILAVIGEEMGGFGILLLLFLFAYIYYKGFKISREAMQLGRHFQSFVAFGISALLTAQTLLNFSVNLSLVPPKGVTLPLISYGGSSIVMVIVMMAILLRIDKENKQCRQF
jgi:cell division protein FtsW